MPHRSPPSDVLHYVRATDAAGASAAERWGWIELFVALQILWGAVLFVPGAQPYRMLVRAVPFVTSLAALVLAMRRGPGVPVASSGKWLLASFALLAANLLQPGTRLQAGIAQILFQISIAAPMFWVARTIRNEARLARLLWIIFAASFVSASVGVLQVYAPDWFLPPEFSTLGFSLNPAFVEALTYSGPDGRLIVRPPGLSDLPGGAAVAGLTTVLLAVACVGDPRNHRPVMVLGIGAAAVGMTALYLTQVRSLTVVAVLGVLVFAAIRLRQGRFLQSGWIVMSGVALAVASFLWAVSIGGSAIDERFSKMIDTGLFVSFQESRGTFLSYTLRELLFQFPFGAGLGRWGMMPVYFDDPAMWHTPPIYVEIQITGWLLDGGFLMWLVYGGALASAARLAYVSAVAGATESLRYLAAIVLTFQLAIVALCVTGPVFNTQLGLIFWTVTGALWGVMRGRSRSESWETDG